MESSRHDDTLLATLEALRPSPDPAFAAALDERAAAGFPRREGSGATPWARLSAWLQELKPRKVLLPAAATGLVAILVATVIVAGSSNTSTLNDEVMTSGMSEEAGDEVSGAGGSEAAPSLAPAQKYATPETSGAAEAESSPVLPSADSAASGAATAAPQRSIERSSQIVLGVEPEGVADAAGEVFEAVHAARGIVLHSSVEDGSEGEGGASFALLIPSARLDDALGSFSEIGEVLSRRDGTADITAPTVGTRERLQDSQARIDALLNELSASETEIERETLEAELRAERRRSAVLRAQLESLQHRATYSRVSLQISTDESAQSGGGSWDVGDAAADAGHILAVAAGVALIGLAVLGPIALIVLLVWLGHRAWVGMGRRRALG